MTIKVLCVGVNYYRKPFTRLNHCINDIEDWKNLFTEKYNIPKENIITLTTRIDTLADNILDEFQKLILSLKKNEMGIFVFSGHGSQIIVSNNNKHETVETIRSYDRSISENELKIKLSSLNEKSKFISIIDSCHSGGIGILKKLFENFIKVFSRLEVKYIDSKISQEDLVISTTPKKILFPKSNNQILLAACESDESAYGGKINGRKNGVFTHYAIKIIKQNIKISYNELFEKIQFSIKENESISKNKKQTPKCFGNKKSLNESIFN
jgi:hypothetical protein